MAQAKRISPLLVCTLVICAPAIAQDRASLIAEGEQVFNTWCLACHDANLPWSGGGTQALEVKYQGQLPGNLLERTDLTEEIVKEFVRSGIYRMPPFRLT